MISKKILNRIVELENLYHIEEFDENSYKQEVISMLENALNHKLDIQLPDKKYFSKEDLQRDIFRLLPIQDLRSIAYSHTKNEKN